MSNSAHPSSHGVPDEVMNMYRNLLEVDGLTDRARAANTYWSHSTSAVESVYEALMCTDTRLLRFSAVVREGVSHLYAASATPLASIEVRFGPDGVPMAVLPGGERIKLTGRLARQIMSN